MHRTLACSVLLALVLGGTARGQSRVETGELNGAKFRIDMPAKWNGGLVLYCHGYAHIPLGFTADRPARVFVADGYAEIAAQAGRGGLFAQKYTAGAGHCRFRTEEIRAAFSELRRWKQSGQRPRPGRITP